MADRRQLPLFGPIDAEGDGPDGDGAGAPAEAALPAPWAASLAARLPEGVYLGTCSWSFPGWEGIVYARGPRAWSSARLARTGLAAYARHPLLRTVEIDRSFYAPVTEDDLRRYAAQIPAGYRCCFKAPACVTSAALPFAGRASEAPRTRAANPDYLSVARVEADLLGPCARAFAGHTGPIVLQFPPAPRSLRSSPRAFVTALGRFLAGLPPAFQYAVELRDPAFLTPAYRELLVRHGVAHAYTYWSGMPLPAEQERLVPADPAPFVLLRLMLKPGRRYEAERRRFEPFDRLVEPDPDMRRQVVDLVRGAVRRGQPVYVLANNKAEGCAPLTLFALAELLGTSGGVP